MSRVKENNQKEPAGRFLEQSPSLRRPGLRFIPRSLVNSPLPGSAAVHRAAGSCDARETMLTIPLKLGLWARRCARIFSTFLQGVLFRFRDAQVT